MDSNIIEELTADNTVEDKKYTGIVIQDSDVAMSMKRIAEGNISVDDSELSGLKTSNQIQLFLLAQAKRELLRVVKLTDFLDRVESQYQDKVLENLEDIAFDELPGIMRTIMNSLQRSQDILQKLLKDDELKVFIDASTNNNTINMNNTTQMLGTAQSREKVRKLVQYVLDIIGGNKEYVYEEKVEDDLDDIDDEEDVVDEE